MVRVICIIVVLCVIVKMIAEFETTGTKIKRMDNDPNCSIKSDKWYREHRK